MASADPVRAVLLDVGGTLLTEEPRRHLIYAQCAERRGLPVEPKRLRGLMYRVADQLGAEVPAAGPAGTAGHFRYSLAWFRTYIERIFCGELGLAPSALEDLTDELIARFEDPNSFRLYPHALELLEALRARGLPLGIVSNWSEALPGILDALGINERVDFVLVSAIERAEKPGREIFRRALERIDSPPHQTVYAGNDLVMDVRGAEDSGILGVLVDHGLRGGAPKGVTRVGGLAELEAWILERAT